MVIGRLDAHLLSLLKALIKNQITLIIFCSSLLILLKEEGKKST